SSASLWPVTISKGKEQNAMSEEQETLGQGETEGPSDAPQPAVDSEALKAQLEEERAKSQQYLDSWRRTAADLQNYKRRVDQERGEVGRLASASLIINILPILDDLERALSSLDVRLSGLTWFDGIRLIYRKLLMVLESAGVSQIQAEGQSFDPRYHEAVMHAKGEEGKVLAEVQRGYQLGDRVIRPALVIIGKGKEEEEKPQEEPKAPEGQE
ncbi:MAG: nucleotide exchange factor GrpE, partial [Dehalococcoidia bacterium]